MKKKAREVMIDFNKLKKMATLKVENREKKTGKTLTHQEKNALINRYVENPTIYFQSIPIKSKRGGKRKYKRKNKTRKRKKHRKSRKQSKKFRISKRK
jgi:hypothetical protein